MMRKARPAPGAAARGRRSHDEAGVTHGGEASGDHSSGRLSSHRSEGSTAPMLEDSSDRVPQGSFGRRADCPPRRPDASASGIPDPLDPFGAPASSAESSSSARLRSPEGKASKSARTTRSLKGRALDYLSRREYSRVELARKLSQYVEEGESVEALIDSLEREGWLSDARFAESVVHRRAPRMGMNRIVGELRRYAVADTLIEALGAQLRETELARALAVWRKKYGQVPQTPVERAKQARFLAMRGFSRATISKILKGDDWEAE